MDPSRLMKIPCTVTPRTEGEADEYNDKVLADGTPVATVCWLHQTARSEDLADPNTSAEVWTVYLPAGTAIDTASAVTVGASTFELTGPPAVWTHPRSGEATFVEVVVRKVA